MKKYIFVSLIFAGLIACNSNGSKEEKKETSATENKQPAEDLSSNADYQKGIALVGGSDCFTCHHVEQRIQGPSYREVAQRYASGPDTVINYLARRIIQGVPLDGDRKWPDQASFQMTPHPTLSEEDAKAMVKYILLLKN